MPDAHADPDLVLEEVALGVRREEVGMLVAGIHRPGGIEVILGADAFPDALVDQRAFGVVGDFIGHEAAHHEKAPERMLER